MPRSSLLAAFLCLLATSPALAARVAPGSGGGGDVIRCGTPDVSPGVADQVESALSRYRKGSHLESGPVRIPVAFHVVTCKGEGDVPQSQLDAQIRELNSAYRNTGF